MGDPKTFEEFAKTRHCGSWNLSDAIAAWEAGQVAMRERAAERVDRLRPSDDHAKAVLSISIETYGKKV